MFVVDCDFGGGGGGVEIGNVLVVISSILLLEEVCCELALFKIFKNSSNSIDPFSGKKKKIFYLIKIDSKKKLILLTI